MSREQGDDPVLLALRAARPASRPEDAPHAPQARLILERAMAAHGSWPSAPPRPPRLAAWRQWIVPSIAVAATLAVAALAVLELGHRPRTAPGVSSRLTMGAGPFQALSPEQYAFAVGGDASTRTSPTQATSGLLLVRAERVLAQRCMDQRGFHYVLEPAPTTTPLPSTGGYPSTFYAQPLAAAYPEAALLALRRAHGFAVAGAHGGVDPDPNERYLKTLSPAQQQRWRTAWIGSGGCYGTARAELYGTRRAANLEALLPSQIYNYLNGLVYTRDGAIKASNAATARAAAAWSRCLRSKTGQTWSDENDLISGLHDPSAASARRLAVLDAQCAYSTGQAQAFAAAFRQGATRLPLSLQRPLRYLLAHRAGWVAKARGILAFAHVRP